MKKIMLVVLAVLMILPLAVSCAKKEEAVKTVSQEMQNLVILDYSKAYNEDGTLDETKIEEIYNAAFTIEVPEGQNPTVKDVVDSYDPDRAAHDTMLPDFADIVAAEPYAWGVYVNGEAAMMNTEIALDDEVKFVYEQVIVASTDAAN